MVCGRRRMAALISGIREAVRGVVERVRGDVRVWVLGKNMHATSCWFGGEETKLSAMVG